MLARLVGDVEALDGLYLRILLPLAGAVLLLPVLGVADRLAQRRLAAAVVGCCSRCGIRAALACRALRG